MKPNKEQKKVNVGTPVAEDVEQPAVEPEEPKVQPVKAKAVSRVKCVWTGPVKVAASQTPSGKAYEFQSLEVQPVEDVDVAYLTGLTRGQSGCCGSSGEKRNYFELVCFYGA